MSFPKWAQTQAITDRSGRPTWQFFDRYPVSDALWRRLYWLRASQAIADRDYQALRSYTGVAPVTRQSGNKKIVVMRRGCNNRLRKRGLSLVSRRHHV